MTDVDPGFLKDTSVHNGKMLYHFSNCNLWCLTVKTNPPGYHVFVNSSPKYESQHTIVLVNWDGWQAKISFYAGFSVCLHVCLKNTWRKHHPI